MSLINMFNLIHESLQGKASDPIGILSQVDRASLLRKLKKTKGGIPKTLRCTNKTMEELHLSKMPERDKENLWEIYARIPKNPAKELPKLLMLKEKYPNVSVIYNYIAMAYGLDGQNENQLKALKDTIALFPNYLFGKISLCEYYINRDEHKKVPKVLNNKFELYMHMPPSVKLFHASEVRSFHGVVGRYYLRANRINRALFCYFILADIDPEHWSTKQLAGEIVCREISTLQQNMQKRRQW
ncbi:MAG: hypothetical protein Q9M31_02855 [Mariprofundus sp.]|nr:hypothetical protein [Mariprofundus sp.]